MAATLAFSPNTQDRHLVLAAVPAAMAAVLVLMPRPGVRRWSTLGGIVLLLGALFLPCSGKGRPLTLGWRAAGLPAWFLLGSFIVPMVDAFIVAVILVSSSD